jgi:hypothetical protein
VSEVNEIATQARELKVARGRDDGIISKRGRRGCNYGVLYYSRTSPASTPAESYFLPADGLLASVTQTGLVGCATHAMLEMG